MLLLVSSGLLDLLTLSLGILFLELSSEGIDLVHGLSVLEWVLLLSGVKSSRSLLVSEDSLNFIGVDDGSDIRVRNDFSLEDVALLLNGGTVVRTELSGKLFKGTLGVDAESTELSTWGQVSDVKSVDIEDCDAWNISGGSVETLRLLIDDKKGTSSVLELLASGLALSCSEGLGSNDSLNILESSETLEDGNGLFGLLDFAELVIENQRKLGNLADSVTSGQNETGDGSGSNS